MRLSELKYIDNNSIYASCPVQERPVYFDTTRLVISENDIPLLRFPVYEKLSFIEHAFSTREGGVSSGIYSSMNLTFNLEDSEENVKENFHRISDALHIPMEQMVYSRQTHTTNVLRVETYHKGMGIVRERDYDNIDGLITNVPGICLVTSYADCVPLFFADPVSGCIGLSHSGWRGTVGNIAQNTVTKLKEEYNSNPMDIIACIGPSICVHCYEVSADVAEQFAQKYTKKEQERIIRPSDKPEKYQLNLQMANYYNMLHAGITPKNIYISDICTCCNPSLLFSHRATKGRRGILCGFLYIKE